MASTVTIDLKVWTTPAMYAVELKLKNKQNVWNWISREKIEHKYIPELDLTLVKRGSEKL